MPLFRAETILLLVVPPVAFVSVLSFRLWLELSAVDWPQQLCSVRNKASAKRLSFIIKFSLLC